MTGNDIIRKAVTMLKYDISKIDNNLKLDVVNDAYAEIYFTETDASHTKEFEPLKTLSEEIKLSAFALYNCIVYGVCAKLALSENDADNQVFYAQEFNERKRELPRIRTSVVDATPGIEGVEG